MSEDIEYKAIESDYTVPNILKDECITVNKYRYGKLFRERNKIRKIKNILLVSIIVIILFWFLTTIIMGVYYNRVIEGLRAEFENKNEEVNALTLNSNNSLLEAENEIAQLRDRIAFLSLCQALYEIDSEDDSLGFNGENEQVNWREYVGLFSIGQEVPLPPDIDTNTFRCMDYRTITDLTSWQYQIQQLSVTSLNGLRVYQHNGKDYYTVALATAYGIDLGNAYEVELENGTIFYIVHAEYKHDIRYPRPDDYGDPDVNYDGENTISVIEFIYDWMSVPQTLIDDGEANRYLGEGCDIYGDGCNIKSMTYLGKIWSVN